MHICRRYLLNTSWLVYMSRFLCSITGAMAVSIKALPTFRVYQRGSEQHVGEVVGTKMKDLRSLVEAQLST
jgi:hypothetical protein